jgi:hypothetical protein
MRLKTLIIVGALSFASSLPAQVMITTGGSGAAGDAFMTFSQDVTFAVTGNATQFFFVIDEAVVPSDGSPDFLTTAGLQYDINGGTLRTIDNWVDNLGETVGLVTASDAYLYLSPSGSITAGDTVTLHAGTLTSTTISAGFTLFPSGSYNMFLCDTIGNVESSPGVAVPEPSACAVLMGGVCGLVVWARRKFSAQ